MVKREEGRVHNNGEHGIASKEADETLGLGELVPSDILKCLKGSPHPLTFFIAPDGSLTMMVFGDDVNVMTTLKRVGLYSTDIFPYCLMWWEFASISTRCYPTLFNIKRELNVTKFLSLPKDKIEMKVNYVNVDGILVGMTVIKNPDFVPALQEIWNNPSLDWSEHDNKTEELLQLLKEQTISLDDGMEWFDCKEYVLTLLEVNKIT